MKFSVRLVSAVFFLLALAGCYFDHPLTGGASKDLNTWLLGVWESKDDKGRTARVMVTPLKADRYSVRLSLPGKKPHDTNRYEFEAWPSRVGGTLFLTLRSLSSPGDIPAGSHVFAQVQMLDQNHARTHGLKLDSPSSASSYELRKEVRAKLKDHSLYEGAPTVVWTRVEEVIWSANGADPAFKPLRNPTTFSWETSRDNKNEDPTRKLFRNSSND